MERGHLLPKATRKCSSTLIYGGFVLGKNCPLEELRNVDLESQGNLCVATFSIVRDDFQGLFGKCKTWNLCRCTVKIVLGKFNHMHVLFHGFGRIYNDPFPKLSKFSLLVSLQKKSIEFLKSFLHFLLLFSNLHFFLFLVYFPECQSTTKLSSKLDVA